MRPDNDVKTAFISIDEWLDYSEMDFTKELMTTGSYIQEKESVEEKNTTYLGKDDFNVIVDQLSNNNTKKSMENDKEKSELPKITPNTPEDLTWTENNQFVDDNMEEWT